VDGEYQKMSVEGGAYIREKFFGKYPELLEMVSDMSDEDLYNLRRGGLDPQKVYNAYKRAVEKEGRPTVILAKTVKGYGLGEAGEGQNIAHQQKLVAEEALRVFHKRFNIPVPEEELDELPFYRFPENTREHKYIQEQRKRLGGYVPKRESIAPPLKTPERDFFKAFFSGSGETEASTTMVFARMLSQLLALKDFGRYIVPIIPDEARTFGLEALFSQYGIYSHVGQLYEPVDRNSLMYYKEIQNGQILEEGITEAGSMSSFIAAGCSYATHGIAMMPFFIYYSMFGFQRIGDLIWAAGDMRCRGFMFGGTAGRTTLNGEGLQHEDGHSHVLASTFPTIRAYDPAFAYEVAIILQDGMKRMFHDQEDVIYYITLGNENYKQPAMPKGAEDGILKGLYKFSKGSEAHKIKAHIFGSFSAIQAALTAQEILAGKYGVSADVWSATSYKTLRYDCVETERWNMLHPGAKTPRKSYLSSVLENETGPFVAVTDSMRLVPDQVAKWVPGGLFSLGTDGYGRSDTREALRNFFEVDAKHVVIAVLSQLAERGEIKPAIVKKAIEELGVNPEQGFSLYR
jgi:pyruvate dehydrogenase E1 component